MDDGSIRRSPIRVAVGPLRRFCEVNFGGDGLYRSIELQFLELADGRSGFLVTLWRLDDYLDVYYQRSLNLDEQWWRQEPALADIPMGDLMEADLGQPLLDAGVKGLQAEVQFVDKTGRSVQLTARTQTQPTRIRRLFVPAVLRPRAQLLRALYIFELGPLAPNDAVSVSIDQVVMENTKWPWPLGFRRHLQARHGDNMVLLAINPPDPGGDDEGWQFSENRDRAVLWSRTVEGHEVEFVLSPPIPTIPQPDPVPTSTGTLALMIDSEIVSTGKYVCKVSSDGQTAKVSLDEVEQSWNPPGRDLSVHLLEFMRRRKARSEDWTWRGSARLDQDGGVLLDGAWTRTKRPSR